MINYYELIKVSQTAQTEEIKKAINRELRIWSNRTNAPELQKRQEAEQIIKLLEEAENILLDTNKRAAYDSKLQIAPKDEDTRQRKSPPPRDVRKPSPKSPSPIVTPFRPISIANLLSYIQTLIPKNLFIITGLLPLPYVLVGWDFAAYIPSYISPLSFLFQYSIGGGFLAIIILLLIPIVIAITVIGFWVCMSILGLVVAAVSGIRIIIGIVVFIFNNHGIFANSGWVEPIGYLLAGLLCLLIGCAGTFIFVLLFYSNLMMVRYFPKFGYYLVCLACFLGFSLGWQVHSSPNFAHIPSIVVPAPSLSKPEYTKLQNLLKASKWQDANKETIINTRKLIKRNLLFSDELSLRNIPCEDLRKIDSLWVKHSQGRFGFSVQQSIYTSLTKTKTNSSKRNYDPYKEFKKTVGWDASTKNTSSNNGSRINLNKNFPKGHFPKDIIKTSEYENALNQNEYENALNQNYLKSCSKKS